MTNEQVIRMIDEDAVTDKAYLALKTTLRIINKAHDIAFDRYRLDENKLLDLQNLLEGATNIWAD